MRITLQQYLNIEETITNNISVTTVETDVDITEKYTATISCRATDLGMYITQPVY